MDVVTQLIEDFTLRPYQIRNTLLYTKLIQRLYFIYFFNVSLFYLIKCTSRHFSINGTYNRNINI